MFCIERDGVAVFPLSQLPQVSSHTPPHTLTTLPLTPPCSAQCLLGGASVGDLLRMSLQQLLTHFPWLPHKVAKVHFS